MHIPKEKMASEFASSYREIQQIEESLKNFNIQAEIVFEKQTFKIEEKGPVFLGEKKDFLKSIYEEINNEYNIALFEQVKKD